MTDDPPVTVLGIIEDETRRSIGVELSDGTSFEVALDAEEARGITPGLVLSPEQCEGLRAADERRRIARQIFRWLDLRPRTRLDLRRRLVDRGYSVQGIEIVLDRFEMQGLVDDRAFAEQFGRERLRNRPVGPRWLAGRLRQDGIDGVVVQSVIDRLYSEFEEVELALRALQGKRIDCTGESGRQRAARFLDSRGFTTGTAVEAIRRARHDEN